MNDILQRADFVNVNFTKDPLSFNEIDTRFIDDNFMKNLMGFGKTNLHSTNLKFTKNTQTFAKPTSIYIGDGLNRLAHLHSA